METSYMYVICKPLYFLFAFEGWSSTKFILYFVKYVFLVSIFDVVFDVKSDHFHTIQIFPVLRAKSPPCSKARKAF